MQRSWVVVLLGILPLALGCGGAIEGPTIEKVVPVSGTLTYQGKPLEYFQVTFVPTDGRRAAVGITDAAGKFALGTNDVSDGAPPGTHKVAVAWVGPQSDTSAGQEQIVDDPSKLPKPSVQIPPKYSNAETSQLTQEVPASGLKDVTIDLK
jgi:hypothetical protein